MDGPFGHRLRARLLLTGNLKITFIAQGYREAAGAPHFHATNSLADGSKQACHTVPSPQPRSSLLAAGTGRGAKWAQQAGQALPVGRLPSGFRGGDGRPSWPHCLLTHRPTAWPAAGLLRAISPCMGDTI